MDLMDSPSSDSATEPAPGPSSARTRWPGFVYDVGEQPDYRFSFANERTYLAWVRTALALLAAGVALDVVDLDMPARLQVALATFLVVLGLVCAMLAWLRWAAAERAMRCGRPLPRLQFPLVLSLGLVIVALSAGVGFFG